ncbi:hypothetical protein PybrP1_011140 [[Pythium] brassicae (nom. inval.)]|nr:hypothetical protein PybrP1_011140 [[Pythium] brassicae (nom. inval.)]
MSKSEAATSEPNAGVGAAVPAAPAKKKSTPKARKRKASDVGATSKTGVSPAKKSSGGGGSGNSGDAGAGRVDVGASGGGAGASGAHGAYGSIGGGTHGVHGGAGDALVKPFVRGELIESIKHMMFGFGDEVEPLDETAALMEDMTVEYVHAMTKKALDLAQVKGKLDTECFIFLIRKDPERYERIAELLRANDELRAVLNSGFDPSDEKMY